MYLISEKIINIKEVHAFEKFLVKRFNLSGATIKIRYEFEPEIDVQNEWDNIVDYLSYRYPMTKAILRNSEVQIDSSVINVNLHMTGKDFLTARGMNKVFENTLENIYGQKYKINFAESISAEEEQKYKEFTKSLEDTALTEFAKKMEEHKLEKEKKKAEKMSKKLEVPYIYFAKKPFKFGFNRAKKIVQENSENIAVIGDQILTDVLGANRSHMYSILVEPLAEKDIFVTRFNRLIERQILKKYKQK